LAGSLPEVDLMIGGPTGQAIAPTRLGPNLLAAATNKGKFLVRIDIPAGEKPVPSATSVVEMDESWPDHAAQTANLERFRTELAQVDFEPVDTAFVAALPPGLPTDYRVTGSQTCRDCHETDCSLWEKSGHAQAWATLVQSGAHVDPYCQQCHTTGYGLPGGFVSIGRTPDRTDVGCESCHGPAQGHVDNDTVRTAYYEQARDRCVKCHDHDNSPEFDYVTYWPEIEHGTETSGVSETLESRRLPKSEPPDGPHGER
jgi:hypothetical protein